MAKKKKEYVHVPPPSRTAINVRDHDGDRVRVWSDEMLDYGQFNLVLLKDVEELWLLLAKIGIGRIIVHHDDNSTEFVAYGETVKSILGK